MTEPKGTGAPQRRDRLMHEHIHDTYKIRRKLPEPAVCPECRAIYHHGRWQWADSWPYQAHQEVCPACHRIKDHYPAGILTLTGAFVQKHKAELLDRVRHLEAEEKKQHPLGRIMGIEEHPAAVVITTTDIHLPHRIGHALHAAFGGDLDYRYEEETYFIRVNWKREN
jgi:NMD protein affecting ribosome stability and mRNA decay